MKMFKRAIALFRPEYYILLNDREHELKTIKEVKDFIASNRDEIKKDLFYVLIDSNTSFKNTTSVIDILVENKVSDYKVINIMKYFEPPLPVAVTAPASITTEKLKTDTATTIFIEIFSNKEKVRVDLFGRDMGFKSIHELDELIVSNKQQLKNVIIKTKGEVPYESFKPVLDVLKKYNFNKYLLESIP